MFVYALPRSAPVAARQFSRALDRFFDDATDHYFGGAKPGSAARTPALDVSETDSHYTVALDVPGITREQLKVTIEGRRLSIETIAPRSRSEAEAAPPTRARTRSACSIASAAPRNTRAP